MTIDRVFLREIIRKPQTKYDYYPLNLPIFSDLENLSFDQRVTFLVGENGTGKSSLLEMIAAGIGSLSISNIPQNQDIQFQSALSASKAFKFIKSRIPKKGFFFRSEDFKAFMDQIHNSRNEMKELENDMDKEMSGYGRLLAKGMAQGQYNALKQRYGNLQQQSHGQAFFKIFQSRIVAHGLYLIDEPETSLSPIRQMAFLKLINDYIKKDCQFIIATHSPIILAYPEACIYDLDYFPIESVKYDDTSPVTTMNNFFRSPQKMLDAVFEDE